MTTESVTGPSRSDSDSDPPPIDAYERRLERLAVHVERTELEGDRIVFDFPVFTGTGRIMGRSRSYDFASVALKKMYPSMVLTDDRQRWGGTNRSVVLLDSGPDGRPRVSEFMIRLDSPADGRSPESTVFDLVALVERLTAPTDSTFVKLRPRLGMNPAGYGPHVGSFLLPCYPATFLNFLADLLPAYEREFVDAGGSVEER